jgi:hypothetical protein
MNKAYRRMLAKDNFDKAKSRARISGVLNTFAPDRQRLLSLDEVREIIKPKTEAYRGIRQVRIDKIVGSEGRYKDFNKAFLPKKELLRGRWESIDIAHAESINLPAVWLYELGGVFFVRDGNHRVSVAKSVGAVEIDAEVSTLDTDIELRPDMSVEDIKKSVILFERSQLFKNTDLGDVISPEKLVFTATGRYGELLKQIEVHKYYINQDQSEEISFRDAAASWYEKLYLPIVEVIERRKLMARFPGRTSSDLYMWMINHWHFMKGKHGDGYPLESAILNFSERFGKRWWERFLVILDRLAQR